MEPGIAAWRSSAMVRGARTVGVLAALVLFPLVLSPSASASTLTDCLTQQHV